MSAWETGWGFFLAGLPWAHFLLFPDQLVQWHSQTLWAQGGVGLLFASSLWQGSGRRLENRPLACWLGWVLLSVVWLWADYLRKAQQHPIGLLPPLMHCLCLAAFYQAAVTQWNSALLDKLLTWIAYSGLAIVAYGLLQTINFDQFYKWVDSTKAMQGKSTVEGTIGNPSHFGTHLSLLLPIFLWQRPRWWKAVAACACLLIFLTHSTTALVCGVLVLCWWAWQEARWVCWGLGAGALLGGLWLSRDASWLDASGRFEAWRFFWQNYLVGNGKHQITGAGLGAVMEDSFRTIRGWPPLWRHVHNEYFQMLIEQGVVGFGLILWGLGDACARWWRLPPTATVKTLGGMGLVFLLSSAVSFPTHLWVLSSLGLVVYCGIYVLAAEG